MSITWNDRHTCTTREEATAALANLPLTEAETIVNGGSESAFTLQGRVIEFAACWKIPCDLRALHSVAENNMPCYECEGHADYIKDCDYCEGTGRASHNDRNAGWYASYC